MSPSDIMALAGENGLGGNNSLLFILLFIVLFGMGGGSWGGNSNAVQADVNRGFDNQNLQAQTRDILAAVNAGTAQTVAATNQTFHDTLMANQGLYNEMQRDVAALGVGQAGILAKQNECCAATQLQYAQGNAALAAQIAQNEYNNAMRDANLSKQIDERFNQMELANARRENEALRQRIGALENGMQTQQLQADIAAATAGVVRYPNGWTYTAGPAPFCGCGCGYNM